MGRLYEDIAEIKVDMRWVKESLKTHMSQHFKVNLAVCIAVIGMVISIGVVFFSGT